MTDTATRQPSPPVAPPSVSPPGTPGPRPTPGARRAWLVVASIFAAVTIAWGTWSVVSLLAHEQRTVIDEFDGVRAVSIDNDDGWVTVRTVEAPKNGTVDTNTDTVTGDTVGVTRTISEGLRAPDVSDEIVDGVLHLRSSCATVTSVWCSVTYTVDVPAGLNVMVRSDNGRIELSGSFGAVDVSGDNSPIDATGLSATSLRLETDNGSIRADGTLAADVEADTSNGSVRLFFDQPPTGVDARSHNGSVEVVVPSTAESYRVDTSTSNGSETVSVPTDPASDRSISARTRNGSVTVRT